MSRSSRPAHPVLRPRTFGLVFTGVLMLAMLVPTAAGVAGAATRTSERTAPMVFGDLYPATPADLVVKQPDGSTFKAQLTNAEIGGSLEAGGYTVTRRADGWWVYATGRDGQGELTPSSARVGQDARPEGVAPHAGRVPNVWTEMGRGQDVRTAMFRQLQIAAAKAQAEAAEAGEPVVFKVPFLMLATWWDTDKGQTSPQFQPGTDTPEYFQSMLSGFGGNPRGTLTEFYFENSYGQFMVQVDVSGPYTSQRSRQDRCYYGGIDPTPVNDGDLDPIDSALGVGGGGALGMGLEAVPQADPFVDFSQYDNNGDGVVDFVGIIHSGPDMAATGDPCHTWSHALQATLGTTPDNPDGIPTTDGVFVDRLFTMPEINLEIGVATHEMAHALGEPDYYNPSYTSMGTGDWDIMAGGSWFGNPPGSNPTGFNPASRVFQGWVTPKIVNDDVHGLSLAPRELPPFDGYTGDQVDPNIVLVPTQTVAVGETDRYGHTWTDTDVYGLARDGDRYVVEGYYLENWSRTVNGPPVHADMTRAPYFDRQALASGLMAWHFDYMKRSNTYFGSNSAGSDPNRPQMDPLEFDRNDNTQELQLALTRGEPTDLVWGAATGITSATRQNPPGIPEDAGEAQDPISFSGVLVPVTTNDEPFTVQDLSGNYKMTVSVTGTGDCTLELLRIVNGEEQSMGSVDSGFIGDTESITVQQPPPGDYIARVGDFAACTAYEGGVTFGGFLTTGAADTWSNWTEAPTGWAITNVGPSAVEDIDHAAEAPGPETITLDVLNLGTDEADVSPGFATGAANDAGGRNPINTGADNAMTVPVFNNGGAAVTDVAVEIHDRSAGGPLVATITVPEIPGYGRAAVPFTYRPRAEGPTSLFVTVDGANTLSEADEANNTQKTSLWAGPASPRVLVVDDDGSTDSESLYAGALAALGIPYAVAGDHVTADQMASYEAVVWEAGLERHQGQLDPRDRAEIASYLDSGGKLLYSSPRAAAALGEGVSSTSPTNTPDMPPFLAQYFGARYVDTLQVGGGIVTGLGDIVGSDDYQMDVFPGRPLQDVFATAEYSTDVPAIGTATPVASWNKGGEGSLMGVRVEGDGEHNGFQSVFLGFNLAQLDRADDAVGIVAGVMDHFGVAAGGYSAPAKPLIFHPQVRNRISGTDTPIKAIVVGQRIPGKIGVYYRHHGIGTYAKMMLGPGARPGTFQGMIPGTEVTPDGVDYFLRAGTAYDPVLARGRSVVHAIGVAIPEV